MPRAPALPAPKAHAEPQATFVKPARWRRVVGSFLGVFAAYWAYWLVAVPLIEPNLAAAPVPRVTNEQLQLAKEAQNERRVVLSDYFPPGSWELGNPPIWYSKQSLFLFTKPEAGPDGQLVIKSCTLMFFEGKRDEGEPYTGQPIIMRAPAGAIIKCRQKVELASFDFAHLEIVGGSIKGPIQITREPSSPDATDDLIVSLNRDLQLEKNKLTTPELIEFRMGHNYGSGRGMEIVLGDENRPLTADAFRSGGPQSLSLLSEVSMTLDLATPDRQAQTAQKPKAARNEPPLRVTCQGPFQFDFAKNAATYRERVDVVRLVEGPADQLNCELLTIKLARGGQSSAAPPTDTSGPAGGSRIQSIEARGDPVIVRSPMQNMYIHCKGLDLVPSATGRLVDRAVGYGPGVLSADLPNNPLGKIQARWLKEFNFRPDDGKHCASLIGSAVVQFPGLGEIKADEMHAWLTMPQTQSEKPQPERMVAVGNVTVDGGMDDLRASVQTAKLEARVRRPVAQPGLPNAGALPPPAAAANRNPATRRAQRLQGNFDLQGQLVELDLIPVGADYEVTDATISGQAHLVAQPNTPGDVPTTVDGSRIKATGLNTASAQVTVLGTPEIRPTREQPGRPAIPAKIDAEGMVLLGGTIQLEQQANHLWIEGPGRLTTQISQDLNGAPLPTPRPVDVTWLGSMHFRSSRADFEHAVRVENGSHFMTTEKLIATLDRPIDFGNPGAARNIRGPNQPGLLGLETVGKTYLESREFNPLNGQQSTLVKMQIANLNINVRTGAVTAKGAGWLTHVGYGSQVEGFVPAPIKPRNDQPRKAPQADQLTYLNVDFQRGLEGNLNQRSVTVRDSTKTVYGPVANWDAKLDPFRPEDLGDDGFVLDARQLTIQQMPGRTPRDPSWFELAAEGNVLGQGAQFTARGHQVTYSQDKKLLILKGDGVGPASIYYRQQPNSPEIHSAAETIQFWTETMHAVLNGFSATGGVIPKDRLNTKKPPGGK